MYSESYADRVSGAVFLIGLGVLFTGILPWWPGILFVIGAAGIARGMARGKEWYNAGGGLFMIALGVVFWFGFSLPLFLILMGVVMLTGFTFRGRPMFGNHGARNDDFSDEKPKNDDFV